MKRLRHCVSQKFAISNSDSDTEATCQASETRRHVNFAAYSETKGRSRETKYFNLQTSPRKRVRSSSLPPIPVLEFTPTEDATDVFDEHDLEYLYHGIEAEECLPTSRKRTAGDQPLLQWLTERDVYLAELLRLEGRGDFIKAPCRSCHATLIASGFRCRDCHDVGLYCQDCTVRTHRVNPLHRIQRWDGQKFEKVLLKDLGLRIQLGHPVGEGCVNPVTAFNDAFVVLDITGIHEVGLDFCGCERAMTHYIQLMRQRWFPATSIDPKTAATMSLLEHFHILSVQSKVSAFEYYNALSCRTDNSGVSPPKGRYQTFLLMVRQWRHLKILKRAGRGNDPAGVAATQPGECAVECPACPHPGKNIPSIDKYRTDESESKGVCSTVKRWWQTLYLAIDANFRLKRKKVSSELADPCLNNGSAFFVGETGYKTHLTRRHRDHPKEDSEKFGNTHDGAVKLANIERSVELTASGIATVDCSRHDMKCACSVSDLQHGEQHVNVDDLVHSSLFLCAPKAVKVSDVACICSAHVDTRFGDYGFPTVDDRDVSWEVPTFHLNAHREYWRSVFSSHVLPEWGRTNGEVVERGWSWTKALASSAKEMGLGSRRDLLDDVFNHWNWTKVITMPGTFLSRIKLALPSREIHVCAFEALTQLLPKSHIAHWLQMVTAWEVDPCNPNVPNPYVAQRSHLSQNKIRVELAQDDSDEIQRGRAAPLHAEYTTSTLIVVGMELEDEQRRLRADLGGLGIRSTDLQRAKLLERQNALQCRIDAWRSAQQFFMPFVASLLAESVRVDGSLQAHSTPLYLPSAICARHDVSPTLLNHEWRLREAQAHDSLADLRGHLEVRAYIFNYKDAHFLGQCENARLKMLLNSLQAEIDMDADRYRNAYISLGGLATRLGKIDWQGPFQKLDDSHIRHISADDGSVGARQISWIWFAGGSIFVDRAEILNIDVNKNLQESLRIEWCKARAQALRWTEECELLHQEMRRVADYHEWAARRWNDMVGRNFVDRDDYLEGADAYAHRQASLRRALRLRCLHVWRYVPEWMSMGSVGEGESVCEPAVGATVTADSEMVDASQIFFDASESSEQPSDPIFRGLDAHPASSHWRGMFGSLPEMVRNAPKLSTRDVSRASDNPFRAGNQICHAGLGWAGERLVLEDWFGRYVGRFKRVEKFSTRVNHL